VREDVLDDALDVLVLDVDDGVLLGEELVLDVELDVVDELLPVEVEPLLDDDVPFGLELEALLVDDVRFALELEAPLGDDEDPVGPVDELLELAERSGLDVVDEVEPVAWTAVVLLDEDDGVDVDEGLLDGEFEPLLLPLHAASGVVVATSERIVHLFRIMTSSPAGANASAGPRPSTSRRVVADGRRM
jgi:hypothetical protein